MTKSPTDLLALIEACSDIELTANLNILKTDFECSDDNVSWLSILALQLEMYSIATLNLYEKIKMLVEIRKLVPKILKLNADLQTAIKSTENLCIGHKFDFNLNLVQNLLKHRTSCLTCNSPNANIAQVIENEAIRMLCNDINVQSVPQSLPTLESQPSEIIAQPMIEIQKKRNRPGSSTRKRMKAEMLNLKNEIKRVKEYPPQTTWNTPKRNKKATSKPSRRHFSISRREVEKIYPTKIVKFVQNLENSFVNTVRLRPDGDIECLVCVGYKIPQEGLENIKSHIYSRKHVKVVRREMKHLVKFHKFWDWQPLDVWRRQFQFSYFTNGGMRCVICDQYMYLKDVLSHLEICSETSCAEIPRGPYTMTTENFLFKNVPFIQLGENFYPVFQRKRAELTCLICNVSVLSLQQDHVECQQHVVLQDSDRVQLSLRLYHDVWSSLPELSQRWQVNFSRDVDNMMCRVCNVPVAYKVERVNEHTSLESHIKLVKGQQRKRDTFDNVSGNPYFANRAQWVLFREVPFVQIGDNSYPTFQRSSTHAGIVFICLICNETVSSAHERDVHVDRDAHQQALQTTSVQESLARYHDIWNALPVIMQYKQTHFRRSTAQMKCVVCKEFIDYDEDVLKAHLKIDQHLSWNEKRARLEKIAQDRIADVGATSSGRSMQAANPQVLSSQSLSVILLDPAPQEQDVFMVISDNEETDFEHKSQGQQYGTEDRPAEQKSKHFEQESAPGYIYYDIYDEDLSSPPKDNPRENSNPSVAKNESSNYNGTSELGGFYKGFT